MKDRLFKLIYLKYRGSFPFKLFLCAFVNNELVLLLILPATGPTSWQYATWFCLNINQGPFEIFYPVWQIAPLTNKFPSFFVEEMAKCYSKPRDALKALLAKLFTEIELASSSIKGTNCNLQKGKERGALNQQSVAIIYWK